MATVLIWHAKNQSRSACTPVVKLEKGRTGSGARSGGTAATSSAAPTSTPAASGCCRGLRAADAEARARRLTLGCARGDRLFPDIRFFLGFETDGREPPRNKRVGILLNGVSAPG